MHYQYFEHHDIIKRRPSAGAFRLFLEYPGYYSPSFEMPAIVSIALEKSNPEKYKNDMKDIDIDLLAHMDGKIEYL
ncbi:MAG: hypothetical protein LBU25_05000 [Treponema sp.]|nr:hypothetical protein [Treponema sp.]